jgi:fumarate hydratase subunit alpha
MRELPAIKITEAVRDLCLKANFNLPADVLKAIKTAEKKEKSSLGKDILKDLIENAQIAAKESLPLCQDTGLVIVIAEVGEDLHLVGGNPKTGRLEQAINDGVKLAYAKGYLRKSTVADPLTRKCLTDNLPAIIHTSVVPGDKLTLKVLIKGGGAENTSQIKMMLPTATEEDILKFVVDTAKLAGAKACPPLVVGVGIGGNFEKSALMSKEALFRKIGGKAESRENATLEKKLLKAINQSNVGPMGIGGNTTALAVFVKRAPCHIAALPVAVNIECHSHRHGEKTL